MKPLSKPFYLAGVKFSDAHTLAVLPPDSDVSITHNPLNPYDPFALECRINGVKCGHIPRTEQAAWVYHTLRSVPVRCTLIKWDTNVPPHEQISVQFVCGDVYTTGVVKMGGVAST